MIDIDKIEQRLGEVRPFNHLAWELIQEVKRLRDVINKAMQQHTVLHMRQQLFESCCIDAEGQYESGHWERDEE